MDHMETTVRYGLPGAAAAAFGHMRTIPLPFPGVVARLREAIEAAGFWVLHEIDPPAIVSRGCYRIGPVRQVLFSHSGRMARLLAADPSTLPEAPLKLVAMALPDGRVSVRWTDPALAFARYGHPVLAGLGPELATSCKKIATAALGPATGPG